MQETILIVVVLKAISGSTELADLRGARQLLENWAAEHNVEVQPPYGQDYDALRYANVLVAGPDRAATIQRLLSEEKFVDAAYVKPRDELP